MSKMSELDYEQRMAADQPRPSLREAAQAVIDLWYTPKWNWTYDVIGELIAALRGALREDALAEMQVLTESEYREDALARLSETHQHLGEQLGEQYELIGRILGTYGGRLVFIPDNRATALPDGTAVYVRRIKR
jgi:hypothetical protein